VRGGYCRVCRSLLGSRPGSLVSHCAQGRILWASFELSKVSVKKSSEAWARAFALDAKISCSDPLTAIMVMSERSYCRIKSLALIAY